MDISSALYIFCDGKKKIDKYGPQDGHPNIVGYEILKFLRERLQNKEMVAFADIVRGCQFLPYDEMKPDQRTDKSSDILGLLWRKGSMKLYDSEEFADVTDYDYQIDLDEKTFRILSLFEVTFTFDELETISDDEFMEKLAAFN